MKQYRPRGARSRGSIASTRAEPGEEALSGEPSRESLAPGKRTLTQKLPRSRGAPIQRKAGGGVDIDLDAAPAAPAPVGTGTPLPEPVREKMEAALGADFSGVRVHEGPEARALGARAYAHGDDLYFARGQYAPDSLAGQELLGHELTHVVQQRDGRVDAPQGRPGLVNADAALEREADALGVRAARGELAVAPGARAAASSSGAIQRKLSVAVVTDDAGASADAVRIRRVTIADRPERKHFKRPGGSSTEGDHTTAWSVMRLGVANRLRDKTLAEAVTEVDALVAEAKAMPGARRRRIKEMGSEPDERGAFARTARTNLDDRATAAAAAVGVDGIQAALQAYIAAYLTYRNAIGLTVMDRGGSSGDGEAVPLKVLQYWEEHWSDTSGPDDDAMRDILAATGALMSGEVHDLVTDGEANEDNLPGTRPSQSARATRSAIKQQHASSIQGAFPNICARLQPEARDLKRVAGTAWPGARSSLTREIHDQKTGTPFAVQLTLDPADKITRVITSGRPERATAGGLEGDHTTAYVVSQRSVERCLEGKDLGAARGELDLLEQAYRGLPGADSKRLDRMTEARRAHYDAADAELDNAKAAAAIAASLSSIQRYASALLYFRNSIALTVVAAATTSIGKTENKDIGTLMGLEAELRDSRRKIGLSALVDAVAGLFDREAADKFSDVTSHLSEMGESLNVGGSIFDDEATQDAFDGMNVDEDSLRAESRKDKVPGYLPHEGFQGVFTDALKQHLVSIRMAAPRVFDAISDDTLTRIVDALRGAHDLDVDAVVQSASGSLTRQLAQRVSTYKRGAPTSRGGTGAAKPGSKRPTKRMKKDDDEWSG